MWDLISSGNNCSIRFTFQLFFTSKSVTSIISSCISFMTGIKLCKAPNCVQLSYQVLALPHRGSYQIYWSKKSLVSNICSKIFKHPFHSSTWGLCLLKCFFHIKLVYRYFFALIFHKNMTYKALETSKRDLKPRSPSSLGKHTSTQATQRVFLPSFLKFHKNIANIICIPWMIHFGGTIVEKG